MHKYRLQSGVRSSGFRAQEIRNFLRFDTDTSDISDEEVVRIFDLASVLGGSADRGIKRLLFGVCTLPSPTRFLLVRRFCDLYPVEYWENNAKQLAGATNILVATSRRPLQNPLDLDLIIDLSTRWSIGGPTPSAIEFWDCYAQVNEGLYYGFPGPLPDSAGLEYFDGYDPKIFLLMLPKFRTAKAPEEVAQFEATVRYLSQRVQESPLTEVVSHDIYYLSILSF